MPCCAPTMLFPGRSAGGRALTGVAVASLLLLSGGAPAAKAPVDFLIVNALVVTVDRDFRIFERGAVAVASGRIEAVGESPSILARYRAAATIDGRGKILMPGLVNTHTHAAMSLLRGLADDLPLDRWLTEHIFPAEAKNVSPEFVRDGTLLAALEMIAGGTTTFADMYYFESEAARAVEEAGLRAVLGETFIDFPVPDHADLPATLAYMRGFLARWKGHPRITPAVAPHSVYTCSTETLLAARDLAHREGIPILIHVAETRKELDDARQKWQKSPVLQLASIGFFDPPASGRRVPILAAHAVWVDPGDRGLLKRYGVAVSHNPESNMKLASGIAPVAAMAREGIVWGLGTDGPAGSNNDLSLWEAMDFAGKLAKVSEGDPTALPARQIVRAATLGGAEALGMADQIGSLEPGKRADLILIDPRRPHAEPLRDPASAIVYSLKASDVTDVWVEGRRLLADRRPRTLGEAAILSAARRWKTRISASLRAPAQEVP